MKKILLVIFSLVYGTSIEAQNPILSFDGIDDYVDLGSNVGNGVRTIEMWFKLDEQIDNTLGNFTPLVARENSQTNINEFNITFQPSFMPQKGKIQFIITEVQGSEYVVYSNNNSWMADKWYHIAAVVDPTDGMMLFIDGIKQTSTNTYVLSPQNNSSNTTIGSQGQVSNRYLSGSIDDVRFSSEALYNSDFTPPCPDLITLNSTIGLWNFNEGSGNIAIDSSTNSFDGITHGVQRIFADICVDSTLTGIHDINSPDYLLKVYPNPSNGTFYFELENLKKHSLNLAIYNSMGQLIKSVKITTNVFNINIENSTPGLYFYQLTGKRIIQSGRLLKK